jgi:hypothetical protein
MSGKMTDADRARQFVTYYAEGALPFDYREKMVVALTHALAEVRAEATEEKPSEPCPSCARKDAALRKILGCASPESFAVAGAFALAEIQQIARAALAEAAPLIGSSGYLVVAPPAAPEPERECSTCRHCRNDAKKPCALSNSDVAPECLGVEPGKSLYRLWERDPAPEPQREEGE